MGEPKRTTFMKIPSSAGIVYAVHGVCHQIANRVLFKAGATVEGALNYNISQPYYGTFGTRIPSFVWLTPLAAAATALQPVVWGLWAKRKWHCRKLHLPDFSNNQFMEELAAAQQEFDDIKMPNRAQQLDIHMVEMALLLRRKLGDEANDALIGEFRSVLQDLDSRVDIPEPSDADVVDGAALEAALDFDPVQMAMAAKAPIMEGQNGFADALGSKNYEKLFGQKPGEYVSFINPDGLRTDGPN